MKPTVEEKYEFLCSYLAVVEVDWYEQDGLLKLKRSIYFQFPPTRAIGIRGDQVNPITVDEAVLYALKTK